MHNIFASSSKKVRTVVVLLAVVFLLVPSSSLIAQSDAGRITGTVSDITGAAIPGATITVTNTGTNATQTVSSGGNGDFTVSALPNGNYHITVSKQGFATQEQNLKLDVSQVQTENFKLAAGAANTVVDVTDAAPVVDLASSDTSEVITGRELSDLHATRAAAAGHLTRPEQQPGLRIPEGEPAGGDNPVRRDRRRSHLRQRAPSAGQQLHPRRY